MRQTGQWSRSMMGISVVTCLKNRFENFRHMLASIERAEGPSDTEVVVVDFGSEDGDVRRALQAAALRTHYVGATPPFRRAKGLNLGFDQASGEVVFFCDADIIVPPAVFSKIRAIVKPDVCFFPICRNLTGQLDLARPLESQLGEPGALGEWRTVGYGMCAFHRDDFVRTARWNESYTRWGGEDRDMHDRAKKAGVRCVREKVPGLYHLHHPRSGQFLNKYY